MPEAQIGRAVALRDLGRLDEALNAAELALAANPETAGPHRLRGRLLEALGRAAEAQTSLAKAAELDAQAANDSAS
jgi:tetratricopeptide (TPR) repeat protein